MYFGCLCKALDQIGDAVWNSDTESANEGGSMWQQLHAIIGGGEWWQLVYSPHRACHCTCAQHQHHSHSYHQRKKGISAVKEDIITVIFCNINNCR